MPSCARSPRCKIRCLLGFVCLLAFLFLGLVTIRHAFPLEYRDDIIRWSATYDLEPAWVASIIRFESRFRPEVVSRAGAIGLMQIMPATGDWILEQQTGSSPAPANLVDPSTNVRLGTWYLRYLLNHFAERDVALMAYNAGPSNVERWQGSLDRAFPETQQYVKRIHVALPIYRAYFKLPWLIDLIPSVQF